MLRKDSSLSLYEESLMEEWLAIVGMRVFVENYYELKSRTAKLPQYSKASARNRMIAAATLFNNGFHLEALKRISLSKGVPHELASLAQALYILETQ